MATIQDPWSGAFISWVMKEAGITFPGNASHLAYAQAIRKGNVDFVVWDTKSNIRPGPNSPPIGQPRVGDIVIYRRTDRTTNRSSMSLTFETDPWEGPSHGDIVVAVNQNSISVVGGNVRTTYSGGKSGWAVARTEVPLRNGRLPNAYLLIIRPKSGLTGGATPLSAIANNSVQRYVDIAKGEATTWQNRKWIDKDDATTPYLIKYWGALNQNFIRTPTGFPSRTISSGLGATGTAGTGENISPYIAANSSFHPYIQYELTRRRNATETINSHMPFVKLTSLTQVYNENLSSGEANTFGAHSPTLGVHGLAESTYDDIYEPEGGRSIVAYATTLDGNRQVKVLVKSGDDVDPPNIPPPGITSMNCERSTAGGFGIRGGLFKANLSITAYSIGQLNVLLRYFLRQGTKVILEMGRMSSSETENSLLSTNLVINQNSDQYVREMFQRFDWGRSLDDIQKELAPYVFLQKGQGDFIQRYTYNNLGNYEIFIGYVATFKINYTKENTYNIDLTVHSVQQFEVPTRLGGARSQPNTAITVRNPCDAIDIMDYFTPTAAYRKHSFLRVLAACTDSTASDPMAQQLSTTWSDHVIKLNSEGAQVGAGGVRRDAFLISWECFVNLVLNDETYGLLGTLQIDSRLDKNTVSTLRKGLLTRVSPTPSQFDNNINSNEVAWNEYLRSTDANVMIIYNAAAEVTANTYNLIEAAQVYGSTAADKEAADKAVQAVSSTTVRDFIKNSLSVGSFDSIEGRNTSYLTKGIWINSDAIVSAFSDADTISQGITNLLNAMNDAVQGYWNLQLLSAEPESLGLRVIDAGLSKPVERPLAPIEDDIFIAPLPTDTAELTTRFKEDIQKFIDGQYLYAFNRKLKRIPSTSSFNHLGSELLDIKYEADMPVVIAVQAIAGFGGTAQRGTLEAIDVDELRKLAMFDTMVSSSDTVGSGVCAGDANQNRFDAGAYAEYNLPSDLAQQIYNNLLVYNDPTRSTTDFRTRAQEENTRLQEEAFKRWKDGLTSTAIKLQEIAGVDPSTRAITGPPITAQADAVNITPPLTSEEKARKEQEEKQKEERTKESIKAGVEQIIQLIAENYERRNPGILGIVRSYAVSFGKAIELIEPDITLLVKRLDSNRNTPNNNIIHPFNASNLTKTTVDLTLPGIGGILLFQAFTVERIPDILKRGYYIVTKVVHEFSVENGWITKLTGRFRYKPMQPNTTTGAR